MVDRARGKPHPVNEVLASGPALLAFSLSIYASAASKECIRHGGQLRGVHAGIPRSVDFNAHIITLTL